MTLRGAAIGLVVGILLAVAVGLSLSHVRRTAQTAEHAAGEKRLAEVQERVRRLTETASAALERARAEGERADAATRRANEEPQRREADVAASRRPATPAARATRVVTRIVEASPELASTASITPVRCGADDCYLISSAAYQALEEAQVQVPSLLRENANLREANTALKAQALDLVLHAERVKEIGEEWHTAFLLERGARLKAEARADRTPAWVWWVVGGVAVAGAGLGYGLSELTQDKVTVIR